MGGSNLMDKMGERLRMLRKRRNMTLGQVEEYTRVAKSTLSNLENAVIAPKTLQSISDMARFYNVTIDYLFGFTDDPNAKIMESFEFKPATAVLPGERESPAAYGSILTPEERWLALLRQLPAEEQLALLQTVEHYLQMDDDQRALVDRMFMQLGRLMTPRIIGGEE